MSVETEPKKIPGTARRKRKKPFRPAAAPPNPPHAGKEKPPRSKAARVVSGICWVLIVLLVGVVCYLGICNATGRVAFFGRYAMIRILSPSMEPTIPTGSYILVEKLDSDGCARISTGDVLMFRSQDSAIYGKYNTHRVVEIRQETDGPVFVTKGDHNPTVDAQTTRAADVAGKYVMNLPAVTAVAGFFTEKWAFFILILIPAGILLGMSVVQFVRKTREVRTELLIAEKTREMQQSGELQRLLEQQAADAQNLPADQAEAETEAETTQSDQPPAEMPREGGTGRV